MLGPDAPIELVIDGTALGSPERTREGIERAYDHWLGDGGSGVRLGEQGIRLLDRLFQPQLELRPLLRRQITEETRELVQLTTAQYSVLDHLRGVRRASIGGPAGSGKTMLAVEKARRLVQEGFRVLLLCFNQPLSRYLADRLQAPEPSPAASRSHTFHELSLRMGREAGVLATSRPRSRRAGGTRRCPTPSMRPRRRSAGATTRSIVDEGQDFEKAWLETLPFLLTDPWEDVFYVFHDPSQALYRPDATDTLQLESSFIPDNCRNPGPIHDLASRFYQGTEAIDALRETGRPPRPDPGRGRRRDDRSAPRPTLHRLVHDETVLPDQIAVLTAGSLRTSPVWQQKVFGNEVLWNGSYDEAGTTAGPGARASARASRRTPSSSIRSAASRASSARS